MGYVEQVKELNKRISAIQKERAKVETKKEMLISKLNEELSEYSKKYGVSLNAKGIEEITKLVKAEREKVLEGVKKEYSLKVAVVNAIDSGDISKANELLGINTDIEDIEEINNGTEEDEVSEVAEDTDDENDFGFGDSGDPHLDYERALQEETEPEDENDFGFGDSDENALQEETESDDVQLKVNVIEPTDPAELFGEEEHKAKSLEIPNDFDFGLEDEEPTTPTGNVKKTGHLHVGMSADAMVEELDKSKGMFEDVDLDDFGFGDMLAGSKLDI